MSPYSANRAAARRILRAAAGVALLSMIPAAGMSRPLVVSAAFANRAQTYRYQEIINNTTKRPDGKGNFSPGTFNYVAIDGNWVVFRDAVHMATDSFWSFNLTTKKIVKLADLATPVPGGSGPFVQFDTCQAEGTNFQLDAGIFLFYGADANAVKTTQCGGGLYEVPAGGGPIVKVVDDRTPMPDGGTFGELRSGGAYYAPFAFGLDGEAAVFQNSVYNLKAGNEGVFSDAPHSSVHRLADLHTPFHAKWPYPVEFYGTPSVSDGTAAFIGTTLFGNGTGFNAIYAAPTSGGSLSEVINSNQRLPGDAYAKFHTRYDFPLVDGPKIYFGADDDNYTGPCHGFSGIFAVAKGGGPASKIVDSCDVLPGFKSVDGTNSFGRSGLQVAARDGTVFFAARDYTTGKNAYFTASNGSLSYIIGVGDLIGGFKVFIGGIGPIDTNATSGGNIVFHAGGYSANGNAVYLDGIFVASPTH